MNSAREFIIVCDHGIPDGAAAHVARFEWTSEDAGIGGEHFQGHWYLPLQFTAARLDVMDGDKVSRADGAPTRTHYEIPCEAAGCTRRAYRSDETKLQTLLTLVFQTIPLQDMLKRDFPGVEFTSERAVVTLPALHSARDTLAAYGQPV